MSSYNSRGRRGRTPPDISHLHSIMVFNISYRTRKEELYRTFDRFGDIADVYIPRDRHGESRGFGFVRFYDKRDAEDAKSMDGRMVDGRRIGVQMAKYGRRHEQSGYRGGGYNNHRLRYFLFLLNFIMCFSKSIIYCDFACQSHII